MWNSSTSTGRPFSMAYGILCWYLIQLISKRTLTLKFIHQCSSLQRTTKRKKKKFVNFRPPRIFVQTFLCIRFKLNSRRLNLNFPLNVFTELEAVAHSIRSSHSLSCSCSSCSNSISFALINSWMIRGVKERERNVGEPQTSDWKSAWDLM